MVINKKTLFIVSLCITINAQNTKAQDVRLYAQSQGVYIPQLEKEQKIARLKEAEILTVPAKKNYNSNQNFASKKPIFQSAFITTPNQNNQSFDLLTQAKKLSVAAGYDDSYSTNQEDSLDKPFIGQHYVPQIKIDNLNLEPTKQIKNSFYIKPNKLGTPELPPDIAQILQNPQDVHGSGSSNFNTYHNEEGQSNACFQYIPEAEERYHIPKGILLSVSKVESGGWPWTLNVGGDPIYSKTKDQALSHIFNQKGHMRQDVAVGCMQIFTRYHAEQFSDASHMIDPRINIFYGAYYLNKLHNLYNSWEEAVARYHSPTESYQKIYLCSVVSERIRFGYQKVNAWYEKTCQKS